MTFIFRNRTIFWDILKWNRGQTKWDGGSRKMIVNPCSIYCIIMCGIGLIQVPPVMLPHHSAICSSKVVPVSTFSLILTQCVVDWGERFENSLNTRKELQKLCMFLLSLSLWRTFFFWGKTLKKNSKHRMIWNKLSFYFLD